MPMPSSGKLREELQAALLSAYRQRFTLEQLMRNRLEENLDAVAGNGPLRQVVGNLIDWAEMEGRLDELIKQAHGVNQGNPELKAFWEWYNSDALQPRRKLERMVQEGNSFLNVVPWRLKLAELESQICRIEYAGAARGTGFLVGPEAVLTNYHVLADIIEGHAAPEDVRLRFDYKQSEDESVGAGTQFRLSAEKWLLDCRKPSPVDEMADPQGQLPEPDALDFALVRVAGRPGEQAVEGGVVTDNAPARQWITIPKKAYDFPAGAPLMILQHPAGKPLQLAMDTNAVLDLDNTHYGLNDNKTRARYRVNTLPGSSGSPCFNQQWQLVALHHSGDPNYASFHKAEYNEGIPITAIRNVLSPEGLAALTAPDDV